MAIHREEQSFHGIIGWLKNRKARCERQKIEEPAAESLLTQLAEMKIRQALKNT